MLSSPHYCLIIYDTKDEVVGLLDRAYETSIECIRQSGYFIKRSPNRVRFSRQPGIISDVMRLIVNLTTNQNRKRFRPVVSQLTTETYQPRQFTDNITSIS